MTSPSTPRIAIVGSGPSGCYLAQSLRRHWPDAEIVILDRLASPFGLIRYGVAADHQSTKAITRQFERLFERDGVRFAGNVELGSDVTLTDLRACFDLVALATGLAEDRALDIPGEHLPGVTSAGPFTRTLNAHPFAPVELPDLGERAVIIGGGNVAVDVLRFLAKRPEDFVGSDIADEPLAAYAAHPNSRITVLSRSGIAAAKSDALMLRELGKLAHVRFSCPDPLDVPADADRSAHARSAAVRELIDPTRPTSAELEVEFRFGWVPERIEGTDHVSAVALRAADGRTELIDADAVIRAAGFQLGSGLAGVLGDGAGSADSIGDADIGDADIGIDLTHRTDLGFLAAGLYRTGWVKRGPVGTIPENRTDAKAVADEIATDAAAGMLVIDPARLGFEGLPLSCRNASISYSHWTELNRAECAAAGADRVRRKTPNHDAMLRLARTGAPTPA
ncbi:FAD-dependent oxidoreductase [Glaciibacter psychrotolerans]|uniref:ferredoxin--NADP(+) reductase n=1 Tax=Glaciibacter psychrotolerans TaxID=670054 RepID=A0A7Z0J708_9MICO|nr:FAD-dependent oxidoreductase [Leifsonia psychrotolerans]NYJ21112.1 ferredoxin--NADP+ reductase [Leifsonia psychrotolerans]